MITVADVLRLCDETPSWTRCARQFRMALSTARELASDHRWEPPYTHLLGRPLVLDDTVPDGTVHFEIPVSEPPRGERREDAPQHPQRLLGVVADPFPRS